MKAIKIDGFTILWFFIITYLFIDCLTGFTVQKFGIDFKLSQMLKISLFLSFILFLAKVNIKLTIAFVGLLLWLLINPAIMVFSNNSYNALAFDLPVALRILMIPLSTVFFIYYALKDDLRFFNNARRTIYFSFALVSLNVFSGFLGYGFYTYPGTGFGFKGYFFAGNELSALYILFSSVALFELWIKRGLSFTYIIFSLFTLIIGGAIGTKTGILFGVFSTFMIPVFTLIANGKKIKVLTILTLVLVSGITLILMLLPYFSSNSLYQRFLWIFENKGTLALLFSGREQFLMKFLNSINDTQHITTLLFGFGSGVPQHQFKTIEMDFFDLMMYFGLPIAFLFLSMAISSVLLPLYLLKKRPYAPVVLFINFTFLFLAFLSGHIWTSGMLGVGWGVVNALLVIRPDRMSLLKNHLPSIKHNSH